MGWGGVRGWVARLKSDVSPASSIRLNASGGRTFGRWEVDRHQAHGPVICSSLPPSQEGSERRKEGSSRHPGVEQQQMGGQDNANRPPSCRVPRVLSPDGGCPIRHKRAGLAAPCSSQKVYTARWREERDRTTSDAIVVGVASSPATKTAAVSTATVHTGCVTE